MFKHRVDHVVEVLKHDYMRARIGADTAERGPTSAKHFGTIWQLGAEATVADLETMTEATVAAWGGGKLYRARSRLYRNQILQVSMRWKALAEIYTMHSFAPF